MKLWSVQLTETRCKEEAHILKHNEKAIYHILNTIKVHILHAMYTDRSAVSVQMQDAFQGFTLYRY